jgi:PAS domain S-box-containing protein
MLVQLQAISDCIALVEMDVEGTILYANATALYLIGYEAHEIIGQNQRITFPEGYERSQEFKTFAGAVLAGKPYRAEAERIRKDGGSVWFDFTCVLTQTSSGKRVVCTAIDITARRRVEQQLQYARTTLDTLWKHASDIVAMLDPQGNAVFVSPSVEHLTGWQPEEIIGQNVFHFVLPHLRHTMSEAFTQAMMEQSNSPSEFQVRTKTGDYIWLEALMTTRVAMNAGDGLLVIIRNINERKKIDEELFMKQMLLEEAQVVGRIGSWEYTIANRKVTWSDQLYFMMGIEFGQPVTVEEYNALLHPEDLPLLLNATQEALEQGKSYELTLRHTLPTGEVRYYQARGRAKRDENGVITALYGTLADVHDFKMQEQIMQENEARFRNIVEHSNEIIYTLALDGTITFVSPAWRELLGHLPEQVVGKNLLEFVHPEDAPAILARMGTVLQSGESVRGLEYRVRNAIGEWQWHKSSGSLVKNAQGEALYFAGMAEDITERRLYNAQLEAVNDWLEQRVGERTEELEHLNQELQKELEERQRIETSLEHNELSLSALVEATDDAIWAINPDFEFTSFNTAFHDQSEKLYGVEIELGEDALDTFRASSMPREEWNLWHDWYLRALRGEKFGVEHESHHQNGVAYFEISFNPVFDDSGEAIAVVVFSRNIAERKRAEEEIRRALEQEKELGELKTRFVSMVSHEFRTPLTTIRSSAELLSRNIQKMSPEKQRIYFEDIDNAIKRMTMLLENVLFLGKAGANRIQLTPWTVNMSELCNDVITESERATVEYQPTTTERVRLKLPPQALQEKARMPVVDERLTRQVITNLLTNALKYSPAEEHVELEVQFISTHLLIEIRDKGIGIPPEDQKLLFEPFHRGENVGLILGTGLGMAIIKQSVDLMKGRIICHSTLNEGTTFVVEIPCTYI